MALLGNIKKGTLPNLLRALGLRRATATLVCEKSPKERATVHMIEGKLHRAWLGDATGENALSELFRWHEGYYYLIKGRIEENVGTIGAPAGSGDTRKHILVVDDDAQTTALIERHLEREGYRVSIAFEGRHALDLISNVKPDLVLLDVMMPGLNGLEVARRLREQPETEKIPIIIISAIVREVPEAYKKWNWPFLAKPFKALTLIETVRNEVAKPPATPDFTLTRFDLDPHISAEIIDILATDLPLPSPETIFGKTEALEIRLALGNFEEETVRFFDLFDGVRSIGEILRQHAIAAAKINLLTAHMVTFGLLEKIEPLPTHSTGKTARLLLSQFDALGVAGTTAPLPAAGSVPEIVEEPEPAPPPVPALEFFTPEEVELLRRHLHKRFGAGSNCAKIVVFGLVGAVQAAFLASVRTLGHAFQDRLTEPVTFQTPPIPGSELARLPLAPDCGIQLYHVTVEGELPRLIRHVGSDLWGAVYVIDAHNRFELNYTKYLLNSMSESYRLPFVAAVFDRTQATIDMAAIAEAIGTDTDHLTAIDVASPQSVLEMLRKLLED
ncbi:MAG: response regulator [Blastocatellia bacterium]|nr:response regulator [Blastocatellia bacterium]